MLYKLRDTVSIFEDNPELLAIPEFAKLLTTNPAAKDETKDRRMRFVALVADRRSPLRTLPERQRREKAAQIAGFPMEGNRVDRNGRDAILGNNEAIEKAIAKYKEYQFDENEETLKTVESQIQEIKDYLKSDKTGAKDYGKALEQAAKLGEKLPSLVEAKQKLESLLNISSEQKPEITTYTVADFNDLPEEEGDTQLSTIDMFHQAQQKREE